MGAVRLELPRSFPQEAALSGSFDWLGSRRDSRVADATQAERAKDPDNRTRQSAFTTQPRMPVARALLVMPDSPSR